MIVDNILKIIDWKIRPWFTDKNILYSEYPPSFMCCEPTDDRDAFMFKYELKKIPEDWTYFKYGRKKTVYGIARYRRQQNEIVEVELKSPNTNVSFGDFGVECYYSTIWLLTEAEYKDGSNERDCMYYLSDKRNIHKYSRKLNSQNIIMGLYTSCGDCISYNKYIEKVQLLDAELMTKGEIVNQALKKIENARKCGLLIVDEEIDCVNDDGEIDDEKEY